MCIVKDNELNLNGNRYSIDRNNVDTSGGNGEIVFATIESDSQEYAIKVLSSKKTGDKQKRFEQEIKFCTQEHHPNVIKILDYGMYGKHICYVMKRYPHTLKHIIEKEDDPIRLLEYVVQLCEAVKYIHGKKVIHRDIKPENILIDDSNLVLADFGMAHFIDFSITKTNDLMANRNYAAPEQRKVGESKKITKACDVYAIGAIINELFTKQKPEGTQFVLISDKYPFLSQLDEIVNRCLRQDPIERPGIEAITNEVRLLFAELKKKTESIQKRLLPNISVDLSKREIDIITRNASFDILSANFLLKGKSLKDLERYNMNYHRNICYNVDNSMKNIYFQYSVLEHCEHKFAYETYTYSKGKPYYSLNLKKKTDAKIYKSFELILNSHPVKKKDVDISGKILKYFSSCCDYHCKELIGAAVHDEEELNELDDLPVLYLVYKLKSTLDSDVISEIALEEYLEINWDTAYFGIEENQLINIEFIDDERMLLEEFKQKWGISYDKVDKNQWILSFSSRKKYLRFKKFALDYSRSDYIFEGDVLGLIEIKREHEDIVELYPLSQFDINYTLARLFGHKDVR